MRLLLIVARLEGVLGDAVGDDGFGDHDGQFFLFGVSKKRNALRGCGTAADLKKEKRELSGHQSLFISL